MLRITFLILITALALTLKAQFSVGMRGGLGTHGLSTIPKKLMDRQVPFYRSNVGMVICYNSENNVGIQAEINYAQKGWHEVDTTENARNFYKALGETISENPYFKREINYLEIPIYSHWEIGYKKLRTVVFAGPYLAFKMSEKIDSSHWHHLWYPEQTYKLWGQEIKTIDLGLKAGLALRYNINDRIAIYCDARYDIDLAGGRDIFIDRPEKIEASRLTEIGGSFGILWHLIPQKKKKANKGYIPKEDLFETF